MTGGTVTVTGGTIGDTIGETDANTAVNGGAFYMEGGTLAVYGGAVSGNTASASGGMLYATGGHVTVSGGEVVNNTATGGNGGAICYTGPDSVTISGGTIQLNKANNGYGGAVYQSSGTVTISGTIGGGSNTDNANTAQNGAAVYVAAGIANFTTGCSITGNKTTIANGGAVGVESAARLYFSGTAKVTGNKNSGDAPRNVYLDANSDEIINTPGLESGAGIGVYAVSGILDDQGYDRGDACGKFGTYTADAGLGCFVNDRNTTLVAYSNNFKIIWTKSISINLRGLKNAGVLPPTTTDIDYNKNYTYYPTSQKYDIYDLVTQLYSSFFNGVVDLSKYVYAYTFAKGTDDFDKFVTGIQWNSSQQRWDIKRNGTTDVDNKQLIVYYAQGSYISIVNNSSERTLTVDPFKIMNKEAVDDFYGYVTAKNFVTLDTLLPVKATDLVLAPGESVKLLFPGAVNQNWSLSGTFSDCTGPISFKYTLDRIHGGTEQTAQTAADGSLSLAGKTRNVIGDSYEILFYDPVSICKVEDSNGEHPFATLNAAWEYITSHNLETTFDYVKEDGETATKTMPGGTIEMILDYLQPLNDVLTIGDGYYLRLTTAAAAGKTYTYKGTDPEKATISRDSDNGGAAVIINAEIGLARTVDQCNSFLYVDNLIFDGKALPNKATAALS